MVFVSLGGSPYERRQVAHYTQWSSDSTELLEDITDFFKKYENKYRIGRSYFEYCPVHFIFALVPESLRKRQRSLDREMIIFKGTIEVEIEVSLVVSTLRPSRSFIATAVLSNRHSTQSPASLDRVSPFDP